MKSITDTFGQCKSAFAVSVFCVATATGAHAAPMTKADYSAAKDKISADYKADRTACDPYAGNAKDVCIEQAKAKEKIARADLEYSHTNKPGDANKAAVTKADANYEVAKEMCDDKGGNAKDVCVKQAKADHTKALADIKLNKKVVDAQQSAAEDKNDADYKVAVEKCDNLANDAKSACVNAAKTRFNKN